MVAPVRSACMQRQRLAEARPRPVHCVLGPGGSVRIVDTCVSQDAVDGIAENDIDLWSG